MDVKCCLIRVASVFKCKERISQVTRELPASGVKLCNLSVE